MLEALELEVCLLVQKLMATCRARLEDQDCELEVITRTATGLKAE